MYRHLDYMFCFETFHRRLETQDHFVCAGGPTNLRIHSNYQDNRTYAKHEILYHFRQYMYDLKRDKNRTFKCQISVNNIDTSDNVICNTALPSHGTLRHPLTVA